jgi:uncharacterized protein
MDVTPLISSQNSVIQSYGPSGFKISGVHYKGAILVTPDNVQSFPTQDLNNLSAQMLNELLSERVDVIFVGTGKTMQHLSPDIKADFKEHKINIETMDTGAACRTFNVLMSDGRKIAAILFVPKT